jgi:Rho-binding antiterminator
MYPYQLVACSFHDELEALATLRQTCEIQYRQTDGAVHMVTSKIIDVYSRDGLGPVPRDHHADFIQLQDDTVIRADRLISVAGKPVQFANSPFSCA